LLPLYAAGFVTAFGAHSIAASLGGYTHAQHASLLTLGLLLAVYDGAEVALKPVFGSLADRVGARPVLLGGLLAFAAASAAFVATRPGSGSRGSGRVPPLPRSPRRPGCWSRGLPQILGRARGSAVTAPGKAWATPWARPSVACSLRPAAILCCSPP
jgi:MFS family permease